MTILVDGTQDMDLRLEDFMEVLQGKVDAKAIDLLYTGFRDALAGLGFSALELVSALVCICLGLTEFSSSVLGPTKGKHRKTRSSAAALTLRKNIVSHLFAMSTR